MAQVPGVRPRVARAAAGAAGAAMTELDYVTFAEAFKRVISAHRLKLKPAEADELTRTYFRLLAEFEIDAVLAAGKVCLGKYRSFPKAADWLLELGPTTRRTCPEDLRHMSTAELDEFEAAARLRYQDHPCLCSNCCRAGVDDKPVRFVPSIVGDDYERAFNPRHGRVELAGHWAHGAELARWYLARDAFFGLAGQAPHYARFVGRSALVDAIDGELVGAREPGQEG